MQNPYPTYDQDGRNLRKPRRDFRLPTSDLRLQTSDFRLQNLHHRSSTKRNKSMERGSWTTPNFQKKSPLLILMTIYRRSGNENHRLVFIAYLLEGLSRKSGLLWYRARHKWEDHKLVWRYRRSSAFLPPIFSFQHFQIAIRPGRHTAALPSPCLSYSIVHKISRFIL